RLTVGGDTGAKMLHNADVGYALYEAFGYVPVCVGHTKEYMRFWQGLGKVPPAIPPLEIWSAADRYKRHDAMWREVDDFVSGRRPIEQYRTAYGPDHATDIIESMVTGLGKPFYINTMNNGAVTNMADDAFLELLCSVTPNGIERHPVGDMPRGLRGLQEQVLDTHELTVEAIIEQHYGKLRRAMLTDPLVSSIEDADR